MYKIIDTQGGGLMAGEVFKDKAGVIKRLADFHDNDFSGVKDDDTEYKDIFEMLNTMPEEEQLTFLLEHGQWELEEFESGFSFKAIEALTKGEDFILRHEILERIRDIARESYIGLIGWSDYLDRIEGVIKESREITEEYYPKN